MKRTLTAIMLAAAAPAIAQNTRSLGDGTSPPASIHLSINWPGWQEAEHDYAIRWTDGAGELDTEVAAGTGMIFELGCTMPYEAGHREAQRAYG